MGRTPPTVFRLSSRPSLVFAIGLLASFAAFSRPVTPAHAQDKDSRQLQGVEAALRASQQKAASLAAAAAVLKNDMEALQARLVDRAAAAQQAEKELSQLQETLATLEEDRTAKAAELARGRQALVASLVALERLAMAPPDAVLVSENPLDLARGDLLLRLAVPELQRRVQGLQGEIGQLVLLGHEIDNRRTLARALASKLDNERQTIADLLQEKANLQAQTAAQASAADTRSAKLAAEAKDLRDLLDKLATQKQQETPSAPKPDGIRPFPTLAASLVAPVSGRIVSGFGAPDASGTSAKGILLETRPGAAVVAPFDGQILFRGPFRSYGEILIIQHSGGYHSLLAGLARSDVEVGQWVLAGEPVGEMGPSKDGNPKLYMELRRDGHPIDPAPWLGKSDRKLE